MNAERKKGCVIIAVTVLCCAVLAVIELAVNPPYVPKCAMKAALFLGVPLLAVRLSGADSVKDFFKPGKKGILRSLLLGIVVFALIMGVYALTKGVFDYSRTVGSLTADQGVTSGSFWGVAVYISLGNSLLEEFFFRVFAFLELSRYIPKKFAYMFSAAAFALYHIPFIGGSFPPALTLLSLVGLAAGGLLFDFLDDKNGDVYNSYTVHMFADIAIMTVWYLMI